MLLKFGLLGCFEAQRDGVSLAPPAGRPRTLLALLLLEPGRTLGRDRAVAELWGDTPPRSAAANLRTHISALRRWFQLAADGRPRDVLRSSSIGWALDPEVGALADIDCDRFGAHLRAGRAAWASGDPGQATSQLTQAVRCHRGTPLQDVATGPVLSSHAEVLTAQWQAAMEDLADMLLELYRFEEARSLLIDFLARQPYRERAWGQLMTACGRSGDVAGASAAYGRARAALVDGLAIEPSDELTNLYRQFLRGAPEVRLHSQAPRIGDRARLTG